MPEVIRAIEDVIRTERAAGHTLLLTSLKQRLVRRIAGFDERKLGFSGFKKLMLRVAEEGKIKIRSVDLVDWILMADEPDPEPVARDDDDVDLDGDETYRDEDAAEDVTRDEVGEMRYRSYETADDNFDDEAETDRSDARMTAPAQTDVPTQVAPAAAVPDESELEQSPTGTIPRRCHRRHGPSRLRRPRGRRFPHRGPGGNEPLPPGSRRAPTPSCSRHCATRSAKR